MVLTPLAMVLTVALTQELLPAQDLDSSLAEFILSQAEGLPQNDMGHFETVTL